jgi:outer membrane lipoprotein carrier protein
MQSLFNLPALIAPARPRYKPAEKNVPEVSPRTPRCRGKGKAKRLGGLASIPFVWIISVILTFILFSLASGATAGLPLDDVISKMQESYENTQDFEAGFFQEVTLRAMKRTNREEGTVYFKKPKRMLWHYSRPKNKKLIINPMKVWLYLPEDRIAYLQPADQLPSSALGIRFLTGLGNLQKDFDMSFTGPRPTDEQGNYLITLIPRDRRTGIAKFFLAVDGRNFRIIQCRFTDPSGNITLLRLKNVKINNQLPESLFTFTPPQGVEVVSVPFQNP